MVHIFVCKQNKNGLQHFGMKRLVRRMSCLRMRNPPPATIMAQQEPNGDFPYLPSGAAEGKRSATLNQNKLCYFRCIIYK